MFDGGYLAVCTARDLGWKRVYGIVHKRSRALEQNSGLRLAVTLALCSVAIIAVAVLTVSPQTSKLAQQAELLQQTVNQLKLCTTLTDLQTYRHSKMFHSLQ